VGRANTDTPKPSEFQLLTEAAGVKANQYHPTDYIL
jgi:hypothetical protein